jgi:hypothetical protein
VCACACACIAKAGMGMARAVPSSRRGCTVISGPGARTPGPGPGGVLQRMHGCKVAAAQDSQEGEGPGTLVLLFARTARCTVTTYGVYYYVVRVHI